MTATVQTLTNWLLSFRDVVEENKQWLTELDSAIGDADHGINMARGMSAVADKLTATAPATPGELGKAVGMTLVTTVGGASGPLYGTFFLRFGVAAGTAEELDAPGLGAALRAGLDGVVARGKGEIGDKTMVDAMAPALDAYDAAVASGSSIAEAASAAAAAAAAGRDSTVPLVARKGRASYLGERSADHMDPGSASTAFLFATLAETLR
ncbi:MAG: dihydroxyacetone kinase subunit L [Propionibacteriaceae bacterium]|jgi:dihydroxyacetone kinase-like protein|nr:dihydroxyacetone kinase subunit L [Propionibacteriaceae bacterium]